MDWPTARTPTFSLPREHRHEGVQETQGLAGQERHRGLLAPHLGERTAQPRLGQVLGLGLRPTPHPLLLALLAGQEKLDALDLQLIPQARVAGCGGHGREPLAIAGLDGVPEVSHRRDGARKPHQAIRGPSEQTPDLLAVRRHLSGPLRPELLGQVILAERVEGRRETQQETAQPQERLPMKTNEALSWAFGHQRALPLSSARLWSSPSDRVTGPIKIDRRT